jgi:nucleoside-diphosphate-sugar epimerase
MTSFVTGAGLVGVAYANEALKQGEDVIFYDARPDAAFLRAKLGGASFASVQGDLRDLPALVDAMNTHKPDIVVHTAGLIGSSVASPTYTGLQINIGGTINVLEAARLTGVHRFVHVSTFGVYDRRLEGDSPIDENFPRGAANPYSASKIANEHIAEAYAAQHGFELVIVRPANVFGYGHFRGGSGGGMTIQSLVAAGLSGEPITVSAAQARDFEYIYCKDLGSILRRAATAAITGTTAFNAGNGNVVTFESLVKAINSVLPNLKVTIADGSRESFKQPMDLSRAKALLDWAPEYSLADGFRDYIEELKEVD